MPEIELLVTCEHGGCRVPAAYRPLFDDARDVLASHRGFDAGALAVARALGAELDAPLLFSTTTRLLVDLNRSVGHPRLYSEFTRGLGADAKRELLAAHYTPYRAAVEAAAGAAFARGAFLLHVSSHSFAPRLGGVERRADAGLLFDPRRAVEANWARLLRDSLRAVLPDWTVRRNYPYRGTSDGLTTHLRRRFPAERYAGIELEINQRHVAEPDWPHRVDAIAGSVARAVEGAAIDG